MGITEGPRGVLRLSVTPLGLGPVFKIRVEIQNGGTAPLVGLPMMLIHDLEKYSCERPVSMLLWKVFEARRWIRIFDRYTNGIPRPLFVSPPPQ